MAALKRKWDEAWQKVLSLPVVSPSQHFRKAPSLVSRSPSSLQWPLQTGSRPPEASAEPLLGGHRRGTLRLACHSSGLHDGSSPPVAAVQELATQGCKCLQSLHDIKPCAQSEAYCHGWQDLQNTANQNSDSCHVCRQVRTVLAQAARTQAELEALFGKFLRAYPLLAPLGDKGAIKYVVWSVLAAPLLALLIPALLLPVGRERSIA